MKPLINRLSCRWLGVGLSFAAALAVQAQTQVTFQVDMSSENAGTPSAVYISGSFNGWGYQSPSAALVNAGGSIWTNTFTVTDPPGTVESCKFQDNLTGWEPVANNRQFVLGSGTQVLPLTQWDVSNWPTPTNQVTFRIDLSAQVLLGNFTNGAPNNTITVSGDFEGWDNGQVLTNNPALSGNASNVYSGTFGVPGFPPAPVNYKFRMNGGWENPASTGGNNRSTTVTNNEVLPLVYYNDNSVYDLVTSNMTVTFSVVVTNGELEDTGYAFVKGVDTVWINGNFFDSNGNIVPVGSGGWWGWNTGLGGSAPAIAEMMEEGDSDTYTNSFVVPRGSSIFVTYKYSYDQYDDENGFQTNHVRLIRSYPPSYVFPTDAWSYSLPFSNTLATIVEPDFGNLAIGAPSAGQLPITWLGRPGVVLQNSSSLTAGVWNTNNGTDATMSTNWPNGGGAQFFRLLKKQ